MNELIDQVAILTRRNDELEAEVERLREALRILTTTLQLRMLSEGICNCQDDGEESCWLCYCRDVAAKALSGEGE